jgi:hypothetical protein
MRGSMAAQPISLQSNSNDLRAIPAAQKCSFLDRNLLDLYLLCIAKVNARGPGSTYTHETKRSILETLCDAFLYLL